MTTTWLKSCSLAAFLVLCMQSLADIAREEAERRRLLEQQGIEWKVVDWDASRRNGSLTISTNPGSAAPKKAAKKSAPSKEQTSIRRIRTALQKLDRTIRQNEELLESRRARLQSQRWEIPKSGRSSSGNKEAAQNRLREQIEDLEIKLKQLRRERREIYESGKKDGFLPGELDGKGIIP